LLFSLSNSFLKTVEGFPAFTSLFFGHSLIYRHLS
jgi:hypothetical protein